MLCQLLAATGMAGNPHSYFREEDIEDWADEWGVPRDGLPGSSLPSRDFLDAALAAARGDTSVFGLRLMQESLSGLLTYLRSLAPEIGTDRACLETAFGPLVLIHLHREDTVDQAISLLRAEQTGLWHKGADGSEIERLTPVAAPGYNFDRLHAHVTHLDAYKAAWLKWFVAQSVTPLSVSYDALCADPVAVLATICDALGTAPIPSDRVKVSTAKLSDRTNAERKARYAKDLQTISDAP